MAKHAAKRIDTRDVQELERLAARIVSAIPCSHRRRLTTVDPTTWPTAIPEEPGFYWCLLPGNTEPIIIRLASIEDDRRLRSMSVTIIGIVIKVEPFDVSTAGARWRPGKVTP